MIELFSAPAGMCSIDPISHAHKCFGARSTLARRAAEVPVAIVRKHRISGCWRGVFHCQFSIVNASTAWLYVGASTRATDNFSRVILRSTSFSLFRLMPCITEEISYYEIRRLCKSAASRNRLFCAEKPPAALLITHRAKAR